jgi:hypothetical protein
MQRQKELYIFKHFAKSKKLSFAISIILRLIPIEIPKKYKIEAVYPHKEATSKKDEQLQRVIKLSSL